jgi:RNA polymerase sigma-70 factor, ECF subfamily
LSEPESPVDPDRQLVTQAANGDREAFDALVRRHGSRVVNVVRALTGGDNDAEDLAQEVFVRAYRGLANFRGDSSFATWLYRVTLNVARSHTSRRSRWRAVWAPALDEASETAAPARGHADRGPEADFVRRAVIDGALASLPDELRTAVTLRDIEGLDYAEIAGLLGIPMGTVESRIFRARRRLRPLLATLLAGSHSDVSAARPPSAARAKD